MDRKDMKSDDKINFFRDSISSFDEEKDFEHISKIKLEMFLIDWKHRYRKRNIWEDKWVAEIETISPYWVEWSTCWGEDNSKLLFTTEKEAQDYIDTKSL